MQLAVNILDMLTNGLQRNAQAVRDHFIAETVYHPHDYQAFFGGQWLVIGFFRTEILDYFTGDGRRHRRTSIMGQYNSVEYFIQWGVFLEITYGARTKGFENAVAIGIHRQHEDGCVGEFLFYQWNGVDAIH